jgi:hypothetical protein
MTASGWTGRTALLAVLLLAASGGCSKNNNNNNTNFLPVKASISFPNPIGPAPVVFMRVSSGDDPNDDIAPIDLVLRSGGAPIAFDGVDVELSEENPSQPGVPAPGIMQFEFNQGTSQITPFGTCTGVTNCTDVGKCDGTGPVCMLPTDCPSGVCTGSYICDNLVTCQACNSCPPVVGTAVAVMNPLCFSNLAAGGTDIILAFHSVANAFCPQTRVLAANSEIVLAKFMLLASTVGSVRLRFVVNPAKMGDCEILAYGAPGTPPADLGIPFDDGGAVFTAHQ